MFWGDLVQWCSSGSAQLKRTMLLNLQSHLVTHEVPDEVCLASTSSAHMKERQPPRPVSAVSHSVRHFVPLTSVQLPVTPSGFAVHRLRGEGR